MLESKKREKDYARLRKMIEKYGRVFRVKKDIKFVHYDENGAKYDNVLRAGSYFYVDNFKYDSNKLEFKFTISVLHKNKKLQQFTLDYFDISYEDLLESIEQTNQTMLSSEFIQNESIRLKRKAIEIGKSTTIRHGIIYVTSFLAGLLLFVFKDVANGLLAGGGAVALAGAIMSMIDTSRSLEPEGITEEAMNGITWWQIAEHSDYSNQTGTKLLESLVYNVVADQLKKLEKAETSDDFVLEEIKLVKSAGKSAKSNERFANSKGRPAKSKYKHKELSEEPVAIDQKNELEQVNEPNCGQEDNPIVNGIWVKHELSDLELFHTIK